MNELFFTDIDQVINYLQQAEYINQHFATLQKMSLKSGGPVFHDLKKYYTVNQPLARYEIKPEYIIGQPVVKQN